MRTLLALAILIVFSACKKEPVTWDSSFGMPLIQSQLGLSDLIPDSLIEVDGDNNVSIRFIEEILNIGIDSLVKIEGDTIEKSFSIAPVIEFEFDPGTTFISEADEFEFNNIDVQLKEASIKSGVIVLYAENSIQSPLNFTIHIPGATLDGNPLAVSVVVPPGTANQNGTLIHEIELANYHLDLTGILNNGYNMLSVSYEVEVPDDAVPVTVYDSDLVNLKMTYVSLEIEYAIGYLGSQSIDLNESSSFGFLEELSNIALDISGATADINLRNSFGVDMQAFIYQLQAWNTASGNQVNLQSEMIGSNIGLSRASFDYHSVDPFVKTFGLNQNNSNLDDIIELIPDSIRIQANASLNPFGNISNYNDFVVDKSRLICEIDMRIPLTIGLTNLAVGDTSSFNWTVNNPEIHSAVLYVVVSNSFPADVDFSLLGLDAELDEIINFEQYLDPESDILIAGRIDNIPGTSILVYNLDEQAVSILDHTKHLAFNADFQTASYPDLVTFEADDHLDILISADINMSIEVE